MKHRPSLAKRLTIGILVYVVVVALTVATHGYVVNERAERLVWESLLDSELTHFVERRAADPGYRWTDTETLKLYGPASGKAVPPELAALPLGVHDEVFTAGAGPLVVLVASTTDGQAVLALDIAGLERGEQALTMAMAASTAAVVALLALLTHLGAGWLARPLSSIARAIESFSPDQPGQRVVVGRSAPREAVVIADALNAHLRRLEEFVERERAFVNMASHELRTPIAVISGTAEVALDLKVTPPAAEVYLKHILRTTHDMQRLVELLLALAKDPMRLRAATETVELAQLVPPIVADHEFLAKHKELSFVLDVARSCAIRAPVQVARAAIGNLLRNAIENSDRGTISIATTDGGQVIIADPGHGMSDAEMSAVYTRLARSGELAGSSGIGIELISRLCEHLGWQLRFSSVPDKGTTAVLDFRWSVAPS
jgi:signal transduction histidine kinase